MQLKENSNASAYFDLLSNLNDNSKLELIAHLSSSILKIEIINQNHLIRYLVRGNLKKQLKK